MPLPVSMNTEIERAVSSILEKEGIIEPKKEFEKALEHNGLSIYELAAQLAALIYSAKDRTRLEAIKIALAGRGIDLREKDSVTQVPTIIFNINSNQEQTLNMFAPIREIRSLQELSNDTVTRTRSS